MKCQTDVCGLLIKHKLTQVVIFNLQILPWFMCKYLEKLMTFPEASVVSIVQC